ncbi:Protoglobin [Nocardia amikacinitolerans]|nr:Protoglobin [Nocardia amikacinitolerans]
MVRLGRIGVDVGIEEAAGAAHPRDAHHAAALQLADQMQQAVERRRSVRDRQPGQCRQQRLVPEKNQTDHADSVPHIPLRYLIAFIYPITATIRPFLAAGGHDDDQVEAMYQAWFKAVTLQIALWSQPYAVSAW